MSITTRPITDLNKRGLAEAVAAELGMSQERAAAAVEAVFETITRAVASGHSVAVTNFGSWHPYTSPAREARNPRTGATVPIPERRDVRFLMAPRLRENVRAESEDVTIRKRPKGGATA